MAAILAFDVGGSHIAAARVAGDAVAGRAEVAVDPDGGAKDILERWRQVGSQAASGQPLAGIAVAFPRPFDYARGICRTRHKFAALFGRDLRERLAAAFGLSPAAVRFRNDADAFLIGALHAEGLASAPRAMGITLGTGLGSAFWAGGGIVETGVGVPPEGEIYCLPWRDGTLEDALSTRAILRAYAAAGGEAATVQAIAARAAGGEPRALETWRNFGAELGAGLGPIVAAFRPAVILLGGNISRAAALFAPTAEEALAGGSRVRLQPVTGLDTAALLGAARACFPPS